MYENGQYQRFDAGDGWRIAVAAPYAAIPMVCLDVGHDDSMPLMLNLDAETALAVSMALFDAAHAAMKRAETHEQTQQGGVTIETANEALESLGIEQYNPEKEDA